MPKDNIDPLLRYQNALDSLPGLYESLSDQKLDLTKMSEIHVFGYGSLGDNPHYPPKSIESAYLWGWSRSLCCKSVRSGTVQVPGLTLGLDKDDDGIVPGDLLTYKFDRLEDLVEMLEAFAKREVVQEQPIYKFEMLQIENQSGKKSMALVCVADPDSPGYVGDALTPTERATLDKPKQKQLSTYKKSQILCVANGQLKSGPATGFSYFTRFWLDKVRNSKVWDTQKNAPKIYSPQDLVGMTARQKQILQALSTEAQQVKRLYDETMQRREDMRKDHSEFITMMEKIEANQWARHILAQQKQSGLRKPSANTPKT